VSRPEQLTYALVSNSIRTWLRLSIVNNRLSVITRHGYGNATITVRATDKFGASTTPDLHGST